MRTAFLVFAALAVLAFAVGGVSQKWRGARLEAVAPAAEAPARPMLAASSQAAGGADPSVLVAVPPLPPPQAPAAPKDPGADLPVMQVTEPPVHVVPADAAVEIAPAVSFAAPERGQIERMAYARPPAPAPARPPRAAHAAVAVAPPVPIGGRAKAADAASLSVDGRAVHLFGVRPPDPRDRCGEQSASCGEAARAALAQRLAGNPGVTCVVPPGQEGDPGYVCHDSTGVDLGRLLVAAGLALADTSRSYQYLGAQDGARSARQGLWRYR